MKRRMRTPVRWIGGKSRLIPRLLPLIPKHVTYVEPFGGGAALLFAKDPDVSQVEVYNDIDDHLVDFFRVLRDPSLFEKLCYQLRSTPYSREEFKRARETMETEEDLIERVRQWYVLAAQSFAANYGISWGGSVSTTRHLPGVGYVSMAVAPWLKALKDLPQFHWRLMRVQVENRTWQKCLSLYNTPSTFAYLDPPYILGTRRAGGYVHEMSDDEHRELVDAILKYPGMVLLSGYNHPIYEPLEEAGWDKIAFEVKCNLAGRVRHSKRLTGVGALERQGQVREECLWRNPLCVQNTAQRRKRVPKRRRKRTE